jgi:hypothetical protein
MMHQPPLNDLQLLRPMLERCAEHRNRSVAERSVTIDAQEEHTVSRCRYFVLARRNRMAARAHHRITDSVLRMYIDEAPLRSAAHQSGLA